MRFKKNNSNQDDVNYQEEEIYSSILDQNEFNYQQLEISTKNLNRRLLYLTIKTLENSFFWRFKSHKSKLKSINETYQILSEIISYEENE
jgi:hypothetical protein